MNERDPLGRAPWRAASCAAQKIAATMVKFLSRSGATRDQPEVASTALPSTASEAREKDVSHFLGDDRYDAICATYRRLYEALLAVLMSGGVEALRMRAWQPQAAESVPFILHTAGMRQRLLAMAANADPTIAKAARNVLVDIAGIEYDTYLAPETLSRNPLFVWGGAVLDGVIAERELPSAAGSAKALISGDPRTPDAGTLIGQSVALAHLVAQYVGEAKVDAFVRFCALAGYHFEVASHDAVVVHYVDPALKETIGSDSKQQRSRPILLPSALVGLPGREDYLRHLQEFGLSEDAVLGIVPKLDESRQRDVNQLLMLALERGHDNLVQAIRNAAASNTNVLVAEINRRLTARFREHAIDVPRTAYVGIFPTNSFNACVVNSGNQTLVLVNTGAFELLEATIVPYASVRPGTARRQAQIVAGFVRQYCEERSLPQGWQFGGVEQDRDRRQLSVALATSAEEFLIAHEYGHVACGHLATEAEQRHGAPGVPMQVRSRDWDQEHEADRWAAHALVVSGQDAARDEERMIICSGPLVVLSLAALVEGYQQKMGSRSDTHPPAASRYTNIRYAMAKAGLNQHARLGASFRDFCSLVAEELAIEWTREEATELVIDHVGSLVDSGMQEAIAICDQGR